MIKSVQGLFDWWRRLECHFMPMSSLNLNFDTSHFTKIIEIFLSRSKQKQQQQHGIDLIAIYMSFLIQQSN